MFKIERVQGSIPIGTSNIIREMDSKDDIVSCDSINEDECRKEE